MKKTLRVQKWHQEYIDIVVDYPAYNYDDYSKDSVVYQYHRKWIRINADGSAVTISYTKERRGPEEWSIEHSKDMSMPIIGVNGPNSNVAAFIDAKRQLAAFIKDSIR